MINIRAMELDRPGEPLHELAKKLGSPGATEVLVEVHACGVCRTDLHILDGEITGTMPIVPGHEVVGRVIELGGDAQGFPLCEANEAVARLRSGTLEGAAVLIP